MTLSIKNMVCDRCILVVSQTLKSLGLEGEVLMGSASLSTKPNADELSAFNSALRLLGFELIDGERDRLVERIKTLIIQKIHHDKQLGMHVNFSSYLANSLGKDYAHISRVFSESQDSTLEKFIIQQKAEKIKELLEYGELNINEIALEMGYSSSAHLSTQFKSVTGLTPSQFRQRKRKRLSIDQVGGEKSSKV